MKKAKIFKIALCVLVVVLALGCLFACGKKSTYNVVFMDGDKVISSTTVEPGNAVTLPTPSKEGATFVGWYTDPEFDKAYVEDSEVNENLILYARFSQRALSISVNSNGGSDVEKISVTTGSSYTVPQPIREGYEFAGYTYIDENNDEKNFSLSGTYNLKTNVRLTAQWRIKSFSVKFKNADESVIETQTVEYGQKASAIAIKGYTIEGLYANKQFSGEKIALGSYVIRDNIDIYVNKVANTYRITVLGWNDISCDVDYDSTYTLLDPTDDTDPLIAAKVGTGVTNEWSAFSGYTLDGQPFAFTGKYTWDKNITVVAVHEENVNYNMYTVTFLNTITNQTVAEKKVDKGSFVAATDIPTTSATGYDFAGWFTSQSYAADTAFSSATIVNGNITVYSKFDAKSYVITCDGVEYNVTYNGTYELPTEKFGYDFGGYTYNGEAFPSNGTYTIADDITVEGEWTATDAASENYFVEEGTYIFLKGFKYSFGSLPVTSTATDNGTLSIITEDGANKIIANDVSDGFVLTIDGDDYDCKIVDCVNTIGFGADFNNMIAVSSNGNVYQKTATLSEYVMDVGVNGFKPDISITNLNHVAIDLQDANIALSIKENGVVLADAQYSIVDDTINFDASYVGKTLTLEFVPKYALAEYNLTNPVLTVKLNNGVNVYTSLELRTGYADLSVHNINILRNIKTELLEEDYESGYGQRGNITLDVNGNTEVMEDVDLGRPKNNFGKGVYARSAVAGSNDSIVVNGNFFSIDGSKLPYIYDTTNRTAGMGYALSNTQIGIFLYRSVRTDPGTTPNTKYDDQTYRSNDGHATINNLRISGNNVYSSQATQSGIDSLPFLKMSSAYIGMVVRGGTVNLDNVSINNVCMGVMVHGGVSGYFKPGIDTQFGGVTGRVQDNDEVAGKFSMNYCSIKNAWCNDIYVFDLSEVNLIHTQLNGCSGAAIHFDNRPYGGTANDSCGYTNQNNKLNMDIYTAQNINNWVAGTEPWFVAYDKTTAASQIKNGFESELSPRGLTIIKNMLGAEMMNLAIVVAPCDEGAVEAWKNDDDGGSSEADIKRHMSHIDINVLPESTTSGLTVFYDDTVDAEERTAFQTGYGTAYANAGADAANMYAFGQFLSYGAMAFDGSTGMGLYLSVMLK